MVRIRYRQAGAGAASPEWAIAGSLPMSARCLRPTNARQADGVGTGACIDMNGGRLSAGGLGC